MTDKEQIKCKYKFQDKEKFDGKTYCTCFCELCEDLPPCDDNCQIYEDFKQLARKTQECEGKERIIENQRKEIRKHRCKLKELKNKLRTLDEETTTVEITEAEFAEYQSCKKQFEELIEVNNKRKEEIKTLKYMLYEERELCHETFKANFKIAKLERTINSNKSRFTYELDRYRKALEEIEGIVSKDYYDDNWADISTKLDKILDIINKAKGEV